MNEYKAKGPLSWEETRSKDTKFDIEFRIRFKGTSKQSKLDDKPFAVTVFTHTLEMLIEMWNRSHKTTKAEIL